MLAAAMIISPQGSAASAGTGVQPAPPAPARDQADAKQPAGQEPAAPPADEADEGDASAPATPIVVSARRLDAARTRIDAGLGATVYSLDNETIENRPGGETGSVASILTQAPGATLSGSALAIRGSHAIQVRINDVIIPEAISDPADQLSSRLAETTSLITGTLPAQFGFAPGGVISVTTKNGLYHNGGQAELFVGSDGMVEPAIEWSGSIASTSLFATGSAERTRARVADPAGTGASDRRREEEGLIFADHVLGPSDRISLILGGASERHRMGATALPPGTERTGNGYAVAVYQHHSGALSVQAALSIAGSTRRADFGVPDLERRTSRGLQLDGGYQAGTHRFGAGLLLTRETASDAGAVSRQRTPLGAYVQDQWSLTPALTLDAGVRADWLGGRGAGAEVEPRAALVWQTGGGFSAHAGYARYAAAAPVGESAGAGFPIERDDYVDAGVQRKSGPLTLGFDLYSRSVRDLIAEKRMIGAAGARAFAFGRARIRGVELSATYAHGPLTGWANISVTSSRARSIVAGRELFSQAELDGAESWVPLASDRPVTATGGLSWRRGKLSLSADFLASSGAVQTAIAAAPNGSRAPGVFTAGLAAVYHARFAGHPADLRLDLTNLTDAWYRTSDGRNLEGGWTRFGQGRAISLGIEQGF